MGTLTSQFAYDRSNKKYNCTTVEYYWTIDYQPNMVKRVDSSTAPATFLLYIDSLLFGFRVWEAFDVNLMNKAFYSSVVIFIWDDR